jgi:TRAP-type C4-dicarboxylate transport system substrate-binding protein
MSTDSPVTRSIVSTLRALLLAAAAVFLAVGAASAQEFTLKFATLAPDGSTWMNVMKEYDKAIRTESGGRLGFKIYPGGVQGDEKDVLRKIKLGQLHAAGITGNGMTSIAPKVRILDSPFLFKSYDEVDHVFQQFDPEFSKAFEEGGFVNLGWAEVGFIYVFTNTPVVKPDDLKNVKMWMWEGDPIAEAAFKSLNVNPIPLTITDVLTSLQTNLINGVYTSPLAAIALQWFSRVKYMLNVPLADAAGAVVVSQKKFAELPPDLQEILTRNGKKYMKRLTELSRQENARSLETLQKNGIQLTRPASEALLASFDETGARARTLLVGKLFDADFLKRVEASVAEYRKSHPKVQK